MSHVWIFLCPSFYDQIKQPYLRHQPPTTMLQVLSRVSRPRAACVLKSAGLLSSSFSTSPSSDNVVEVDGCNLHVKVQGPTTGDKKLLLCLPGAMGTAETDWQYQFEGLSEAHTVVSFDPRGYGKSRPPGRRFPADYYHRDAADGVAVMDALFGSDAIFDVMGWSDGANAGVILAAKNVFRVRKLVIFGGNSYLTDEDIEAYEATRDVEATWSPRMRGALEAVYGLEELQKMWSSACDGWGEILREGGGDICQKEARALLCPTLVLGGEKDPIVPTFHPHWFADNIPGSSLHMFPQGKHNIHQKYAEEFNKKVAEFLA